jgi:hypothetical protein
MKFHGGGAQPTCHRCARRCSRSNAVLYNDTEILRGYMQIEPFEQRHLNPHHYRRTLRRPRQLGGPPVTVPCRLSRPATRRRRLLAPRLHHPESHARSPLAGHENPGAINDSWSHFRQVHFTSCQPEAKWPHCGTPFWHLSVIFPRCRRNLAMRRTTLAYMVRVSQPFSERSIRTSLGR